MTSKFKAKFCN